jgi:hypothetical protein
MGRAGRSLEECELDNFAVNTDKRTHAKMYCTSEYNIEFLRV